MVMLTLRFDLRNPAFAGVSSGERLRACVEMAEWADRNGGVAVSLSEHHGSEDGYLPSPLVMASAIASRTERVNISIAALLAPFYDPIRLAEDVAVLDNLSGGRITLILGGGYVSQEFAMYGVPPNQRGKRVERAVDVLRKAWSGKPFEYEGHTVQVTPTPDREGGPPLMIGGSSTATAKRAARIGDGYAPQAPGSWDAYRAEMVKLGKEDPGPMNRGALVTTCIAEDPESAWDELVPYFMHECNSYGAWLEAEGLEGPYRTISEDELRADGMYRIITPEQARTELEAMGDFPFLMFHPMVGGIPPARAWEMLQLVEREILNKS